MAQTCRLITCLATCVACLIITGCPTGNELGGMWRPVKTEGNLIYDSVTGEPTVGFELWMEHYGPDIAGLIRFYRPADEWTAEYEAPRDPRTDNQCGCIYMHNGRYGETWKSYRFTTKGCLPGIAGQSVVHLSGAFTLNDDDQLTGRLKVEGDSPHAGEVENMVLEREASAGSILPSEFTCERVLDANAGNIHSGN